MTNATGMPPSSEELGNTADRDTTVPAEERAIIPPRPKRRPPRKHKFLAGLLAVFLPGAGHLYLGLFRTGISLIFLILVDIASLLYFSSIGMQINVPLLILLALFIPVVYFYNIYNVLQASDRILYNLRTANTYPQHALEQGMESPDNSVEPISKRTVFITEPGLSFGLLLLFGGALLFLFRQKPPWLQLFIENYSGLTIAMILLGSSLTLGIREIYRGTARQRRKGNSRRRVGRYTAAALLVGVSILLLLDWKGNPDALLLLLKWWPAVPVFWGLEYLLMFWFGNRPISGAALAEHRLRLDLRGLVLSLVAAACVFVVAEQEHYLHLWNRVNLNLTAAAVDYSEASGSKFQKQPLIVPVELNSAKISINAINGDILLHKAPVEDIEIVTTVWVDQLEGVMAEAISDQSFIEVSEGPTIKLTPKGKAYGDSGKRQPRMDMDIYLPEDRRFNLEVRTMNGGITLQNVEAIENISLETGNGPVILNRVFGNVTGKTLNGEVRVRSVQGSVEISTGGGAMNAWDIAGSLKLTTAVGDIGAINSGDAIHVASKNGNLTVSEARAKLHAESLNGNIDIRSSAVGGEWDIYSAVGDLNLYLPEEANFSMDGSSGYGDIISEFPQLPVDKKTISGEIGNGEFKLHVEGNSNLNVRKY
ncbi:DUF4097 domain-containing protein [Paenibacillus sp. sgz500958]|uniref:DUF4097 family beta strand repeat-containing protein n=1 Tax=Paenibacillus sp. sgz500958 TaxID=3242475 RepID=UPI0036D38336